MSQKKQPSKLQKDHKTGKPVEKKVKAVVHQNPWEPAMPVTDQDPMFRNIFWGLGALIFVILAFCSLGSGINGDDSYQNDYSAKLVSYYSTMGKDTSALNIPRGNMHFYGGFFDIVTGFTNKAFGYTEDDQAYHNLRHLFIAFFGFMGMLFTALLIRDIAGWRAGILTLLLMALSPRFFGDSLMNPKDIPFATGNIMALYYMIKVLKDMPKPKWTAVAGAIAGIALAISTRAGGMLLMAYICLFAALDFYLRYGLKSLFEFKLSIPYALYAVGIAIVGYVLAILFWPYALKHPLSGPIDAMQAFSDVTKIRVLFKGSNIMSNKTSWDYPLQWIFRTIPLFTVIGVVAGLALVTRAFKKYASMPVYIVYFSAIFPLAYVIYKHSILHDGWRHLTFIYPSLVALAALAWMAIEGLLDGNKVGKYVTYSVLGLCMLEPAVFIARNIHYPYVYFNPINGGMKGAFGRFETDYWGISVKDGVDWLEKQGIIGPNMKQPVTIASSFSYNLDKYVKKKYKGMVKVAYAKYARRYDASWDYALFPSRFVYGTQLRAGKWPPSNTIHTIDANGVPILAILKDSDHHVFNGNQLFNKKDFPGALAEYNAQIAKYPDDELAWMGIANIGQQTGNVDEMKRATDKCLEIDSDNISAMTYLGLYYAQIKDIPNARLTFEKTVEVNEDYYLGYFYLAVLDKEQQDPSKALENIKKCLMLEPNFKTGYQLAAQIYQEMGDNESAQKFMQMAK